MPSPSHHSAGFSLVETLIAILILGIVITTSLFVYYERERRMIEAGEVMLVWQVLGNEAEARRYASWGMQAPGPPQPFYTDLALLAQLEGVVAEAAVEQVDSRTRRILLRISWREGSREAIAEVIRTDTGGGTLW
jgi:prepilin-type N-terminal cleavage/methylation domain-containing protein